VTVQKNDKKTIFGWAMYDWANSAFATVMLTAVFPVFFEGTIVGDDGWNGINGEALWGFLTGGAALVLFLFMPVLGAIADFSASKRKFLRVFAYGGALFTSLLFFATTGSVVYAMVIFVLSQFGFVGANVFYDGFLPDISTDDTIDRVSSKGFALGYIGGGLYLLMSFILIQFSESFGMETLLATKLSILGVGLWWAGFSVFAFKRFQETGEALPIPEEHQGKAAIVAYTVIGIRRAIDTARRIAKFRHLLLFVVAFLLYNDAVQTTISQAGAYASGTLDLDLSVIAGTVLIVQFVAFGGALMFGWLADRLNTKLAIQISLGLWVLVALGAYFLPVGEATPFLVTGVAIGFVLGGTQALSRSLYGSMIPEEASAEFYGFFSVISKFSAIWGPLIFGALTQTTGSGRAGILSLVAFFVIGLVLLSFVDVDKARASRAEWEF
jgi:UMF1 family MFS transporter